VSFKAPNPISATNLTVTAIYRPNLTVTDLGAGTATVANDADRVTPYTGGVLAGVRIGATVTLTPAAGRAITGVTGVGDVTYDRGIATFAMPAAPSTAVVTTRASEVIVVSRSGTTNATGAGLALTDAPVSPAPWAMTPIPAAVNAVIHVNAGEILGRTFDGWTVAPATGAGSFVAAREQITRITLPPTLPAGDIVLTANWRSAFTPPMNPGDNNEDEKVEPPVVEKPHEMTPAEIKDILDDIANRDEDDDSPVVLDFSDIKVDTEQPFGFIIDSSIAAAAIEAGLGVTLITPTFVFELDAAALAVAHANSQNDIEVRIEIVSEEDNVFKLAFVVNNEVISYFTEGNVTIALPFEPAEDIDTNMLVVRNVTRNTLLRSKFEDGFMYFITNRFSEFQIEVAEAVEFADMGDARPGMGAHADFVSARGLFKGNPIPGADNFNFNFRGNITYGELAAVLANYSGQTFTSFPAQHITWAETSGVFEGVTFEPRAAATRADMALMIYNYIEFAGEKVYTIRDLSFTDIEDSDAADAIIALANSGIISGDTAGTFRPDETITREEVAAIIAQFVKAFGITHMITAD
jgi:hypothetical protein